MILFFCYNNSGMVYICEFIYSMAINKIHLKKREKEVK
jgi:hypothetical protein